MKKINKLIGALITATAILMWGSRTVSYAQTVRVTAVLFYSPTCPHCHIVLEQVLPPLLEKYGEQLEIYLVNVSEAEGQQLYRSAIDLFQIPDERRGVPTLIVGDKVLVGSGEIPEQFPGLIEAGLKAGGVPLPAGIGLKEASPILATPPEKASETPAALPTSTAQVAQAQSSAKPSQPLFMQRFNQDPVGNSLSVAMLIGMVISIIVVIWIFLGREEPVNTHLSEIAIPILSIAGLAVAGYLSYVELLRTPAVCGPIGDCNTVQSSPYAYLFGVIPVGLLGVVGYLLILALWGIYRFSSSGLKKPAALLGWGMAWFGVFFSAYLTFLEPFVIGATCAWCLMSALLMTLLLWAYLGPAINAWNA